MDGDGQIDISINEPEDTIDPIQYIGYIRGYVETVNMDKQMKNYLLVKLRVIKDLIKKDNPQAVGPLIDAAEKHISQMTGKFITVERARALLEMIGRLKNLML